MKREKSVEQKAQRIGDIVELLIPYAKRTKKLDANFNIAMNKAEAMSAWLAREWIPLQPDKALLTELSSLVGMLDFVGFVFHGDKYWGRVEQIREMIRPGIERV